MTRVNERDINPEELPAGRILPGDARWSDYRTPEWGDNRYLLKKWAKNLDQAGISCEATRLQTALMLEYQSRYKKSPLQVFAELVNKADPGK